MGAELGRGSLPFGPQIAASYGLRRRPELKQEMHRDISKASLRREEQSGLPDRDDSRLAGTVRCRGPSPGRVSGHPSDPGFAARRAQDLAMPHPTPGLGFPSSETGRTSRHKERVGIRRNPSRAKHSLDSYGAEAAVMRPACRSL